jgi:hypothetical protein
MKRMLLARAVLIGYTACLMGSLSDGPASAVLSVCRAGMPPRHDDKRWFRGVGLMVAALAFLLQVVSWAWAPAQAAAFVNGQDGEILICTGDGLVKFTPDGQGDSGDDNAASGHGCPLCPLVGGLALPPQPPLQAVPVRIIRLQAAALPGAQIAAGWFLATLQARAPPPIG